MKCWRCLEEVSAEDPSCPYCEASFPTEKDEAGWKLERNWLDHLYFIDAFAHLFWPGLALLFIDVFTDVSLKISGGSDWLRALIIAFTILFGACHSVKRGVLSGRFFDVERDKNPTAFNMLINIQVLLFFFIIWYSINELSKTFS